MFLVNLSAHRMLFADVLRWRVQRKAEANSFTDISFVKRRVTIQRKVNRYLIIRKRIGMMIIINSRKWKYYSSSRIGFIIIIPIRFFSLHQLYADTIR